MDAIASFKALNSNNEWIFSGHAFLDSAVVLREVLQLRESEQAYVQGDPATSVMYIQEGEVKLSIVNEVGREAIVALLGPGDFFGEGCLAGQSARTGTATAVIPTTIRVIPKNEMMHAIHTECALPSRFMSYLLSRTLRAEEDLIDHLFNSIEKRLARTLLLLARYGKDGPPRKVLPRVSQEILAEMIGASRPRVNYFMIKFKKLGFIEYEGYNGEIYINQSLLSVVLHD